MSENRFKLICRFVTFNDKPARTDHWKRDYFADIKEIFEAMNIRNAKMRYPSALLTIDETLYPYRGCNGFKQYNHNKPAKYSLLYRSLCNTTILYTYFSSPYAGKPETFEGDAVKCYIIRTDEYSKYLVNGLSAHYNMQGINISIDRYFMSFSLASWALGKQYYNR